MNISRTAIQENIIQHKYVYLLTVLIVLLNIKVFIELIGDWYRDDNYSHGFLIIPISIYLFYRQKDKLKFPAVPNKWGMLFFIFGCLGLILGIAASEYFTTRFAIVLMITSLALYYLGYENFKKVWFCFFFLLFMIPIPSTIYYSATLPLQLLATKASVILLKIIGVPVVRDGNIIHLPDYSLEVAEACSGIRSLVALMSLSALYSYLRMPGKVLPITLFFSAIPIAIITNIFRIFVTAIGAYAISKEIAEEFLHEISGMLIFVTALIIIVILGSILKWTRNRFQS
jgi:exosortase